MSMKKIVAGVLACCIVGGVMPTIENVTSNTVITASAEDEAEYIYGKYKQLTYRNYGGYIEISGYDNSVSEVVIPAEIDGLPVTSIGESAFYFTGVTSIEIPDSVTIIKNRAFEECALTSITIPDSVTSIENDAFCNCYNLTSVTIPNSVTNIGENAFGNTSWIKFKQEENPLVIVNGILIDGTTCSGDVVVPDGVTSIGCEAFRYCESLT